MQVPNPRYDQSIVSVANSVLRHFGCHAPHPGLPQADAELAKGYQNVILMVLDGLGLDLLQQYLPPHAFLRQHCVRGISSVFPPTTAAAIPSICSGRTPAEHGWLGWSLYFEELGLVLKTLGSKNVETDEDIPGRNPALDLLPYTHIAEQITLAGQAQGHILQNFGEPGFSTAQGMVQQLLAILHTPGRHFIYCYSHQPDEALHLHGIGSPQAVQSIVEFDSAVASLAEQMPHTLLLAIADHGHVPLQTVYILEHEPALLATLRVGVDLDGTTLGFRPKPGHEAAFVAEARRVFGADALLVPKAAAIAQRWFGNLNPTQNYPQLHKRLADYLLILPSGARAWRHEHQRHKHRSAHSGADSRELTVPLITFGRR